MDDELLIKHLTQLLLIRQREAREAQNQRELLAVKASILSALCDLLRWRRDTLHSALGLQSESGQGILPDDEESLLLQEFADAAVETNAACVTALDGSAGDSATSRSDMSLSEQRSTVGHASHQPQTVATAGDPLALYRRLLQLPPASGVENITLQTMLSKYSEVVRELSLAVQLHELGLENQTGKMEVLLIRCLHMLASIIKMYQGNSRAKVPNVLQLCLTDYETGKTIAEPDKQRLTAVLPLLGLTPYQMQRIALGAAVFQQLLSPVLQELRQLQQATGVSGPPKNSDSIMMSTESVGQMQQDQQQAAATQQQQQPLRQQHVSSGCLNPESPSLEEQQNHAARMSLLLRKDTLLRSVAACYTFGCLSYLQLAKLHVYNSPFYPHVGTFQQVVVEQLQQQHQEQQQQWQEQLLLQDNESTNECCFANDKVLMSNRMCKDAPEGLGST